MGTFPERLLCFAAPLYLYYMRTQFKSNGYLKKTYLDKDGAKQVTFEFSSKDALELAKLELMSRDLKNHLPVLLEVTVKVSLEQDYKNNAKSKHSPQTIR